MVNIDTFLMLAGNLGSLLAGVAAIWVVSTSQRTALGVGERPHAYKKPNGALSIFVPLTNYGNSPAIDVLIQATITQGGDQESVQYELSTPWYPRVPLNWDLAGATIPSKRPFEVEVRMTWKADRFITMKRCNVVSLRWSGSMQDLNLYLKNSA